MGYFFIENEHDYDEKRHFYCKYCKECYNHNVEITSCYKCTQMECETIHNVCYVLLSIDHNNINFIPKHFKEIDIHTDTESKLILLDLDPVTPYGCAVPIECRLCRSELGWVIESHQRYNHYRGLILIKKDRLL